MTQGYFPCDLWTTSHYSPWLTVPLCAVPPAAYSRLVLMSLQLTHGVRWWWAGDGGGWLACFLHLARDVITPTDSDSQRASACSQQNASRVSYLLQTQAVWSCLERTQILNIKAFNSVASDTVGIVCHVCVVVSFWVVQDKVYCVMFVYLFFFFLSWTGKIRLCKHLKRQCGWKGKHWIFKWCNSERPRWFTFPQEQRCIPVLQGPESFRNSQRWIFIWTTEESEGIYLWRNVLETK